MRAVDWRRRGRLGFRRLKASGTAYAMVAVGAVVAVVTIAGPARAESKTQAAREAAETGRRAYNLNHWDEAVAAFEKAYQLSGDPALLFNLAQAHRQAGHGNEAVHFYKTYLREQPDGPNREIATKQLNELQAQNWHDPFDTPESGARATAPPPAVARPTAPPPSSSVVVVPPPGPAAASPAPVAPPPAAASPAVAPSASDAPVVVAPQPAPPRRTPLPRGLPLAGAVATVALMSAAIVYGVSASSRYDELASSCGRTMAGCAPSDINQIRSQDRTATVLWIATGVVAAATGVAAFVNAREAGVSALWRF